MTNRKEKVAGIDVLVKISDGLVIGGQSGASLNRTMNVIETNDKTSGGWSTKIKGIKEWSIDAEAFMVIDDEAYRELSKAFNDGTDVEVSFEVGNIQYTGYALVTDFPLDLAQDSAVTFTVTFDGNGALEEEFSTPS
ncbi:phage tail tube protein [Geomicrobium sp. JCM 19055]|uniref:phage tail tube protein n=1 Tax=Geomicrobium sp. JCM 19055 TaxID=1460649 RepID=UPI00045ECFC0|nr:phage tail tube protein [Geomicrobium sp. JCM 19055]GAK00910.1 phage protein [Geomicrobium sp. JCM 19055]